MVLKRMKRRHSRAASVETVRRLKAKRPGIAIGADLIAGFPTESDEMAENSLRLIDDCDIVMGHIFPFSPKKGTPAARMPLVPAPVVKERARRLREATARRKALWLQSLVGTRQKILVEREDGTGHAENFAPVRILPSPPRHPREGGDPDGLRDSHQRRLDSRFRGNDEVKNEVGKIVEARITALDGDTLVGEKA
jgi:threonylcarbamoyladenosine tRNA methylthiotransferase MtaB